MPLNIVMPRSYGLALPVELGTLDRCGRGRVLQIIPEAKRRQYKQVLDAYEAAQNEENPEPKPAPKP